MLRRNFLSLLPTGLIPFLPFSKSIADIADEGEIVSSVIIRKLGDRLIYETTEKSIATYRGGMADITDIIAPNATYISCQGASKLKNIIAPKIETLDCSFCSSIKSINLPNVRSLICSYCCGLKYLYMPSVIYLEATDNKSLEALNLPSAQNIYCKNCYNLTRIYAPHVNTLDCQNCRSLQYLAVAKASICHHGCSMLSAAEKDRFESVDSPDIYLKYGDI